MPAANDESLSRDDSVEEARSEQPAPSEAKRESILFHGPGFRARFAVTPEEESDQLEVGGRTVRYTTWIAYRPDGSSQSVAFMELSPGERLDLAGAVNGAASNIGASVSEVRRVQLAGRDALRYRAGKEDLSVSGIVVRVTSLRGYHVSATGDARSRKRNDEFIDSFELVEP